MHTQNISNVFCNLSIASKYLTHCCIVVNLYKIGEEIYHVTGDFLSRENWE